MTVTPEKISVSNVAITDFALLNRPIPSPDPFDKVGGVRPRRVFPDEVTAFEELNESATSARWTASRRRKSEV